MSDNNSTELRQLWAAVRHAQRLSDRIRARVINSERNNPSVEEGIAVVPIKEADLLTKRHLVRRTAR